MTQQIKFICKLSISFSLLIYFYPLVLFPVFIYDFLRLKKTVVLLQQRRKISLSISIIKRDRTDWLSCSQVDMPASALPKSTNWLTTASAAVALCVSKRARDPASSVEAWYASLFSLLIPVFNFSRLVVLTVLIFYFSILYSFFFYFRFAQKRSRRSCSETPTKARNYERSLWEVRVKRCQNE